MDNSSNVQPELSQAWTPSSPLITSKLGTLLSLLGGWATWQYVVTLVLSLVVYDQGIPVFNIG